MNLSPARPPLVAPASGGYALFMPQETKTVANPPNRATSLHGLFVSGDDSKALLAALEQAFDYRGDVTILTTTNEKIEGFLFDRRTSDSLDDSSLRLLCPNQPKPREIHYNQIASIEFTGTDPAHGKSFDTWVKKYTQKKLAGEAASIYNDEDVDDRRENSEPAG